MSEYRGWGKPAPYTDKWTNVDPGPPPTAPKPMIELPVIDDDPEGANPDELFELPDGTFVDYKPSGDEIMAAQGMLDPTDPRTRRDPETGAPIEREDMPYKEGTILPNESPWSDPMWDAGEESDKVSNNTRYSRVRIPPDEPLLQRDEATGIFVEKGTPPLPGMPEPTKAVQRWADVAMWQAPAHTDPQKPKVTISMCTPDPLGIMAMVNSQYTGRNLTSPSQVTDDERREAWEAATVSKLSETPLEWIQWSINFENVSRAFTHQLVRTRMATYAQESQRFAVKDSLKDSTKLPPSIAGTVSEHEFMQKMVDEGLDPEINFSDEQRWRNEWDQALTRLERAYGNLVNSGMPAEDARGLLPTNMLTRVHMRVDMKTLLNLAGMRLCTQAQFEWRAVFAELAKAIRTYTGDADGTLWQYELIANSFRPVCYSANRCTMKAKSDRHCSIRDQVDAFEAAGVKSDEWEKEPADRDNGLSDRLSPIRPEQWLLDPAAARVAPGQEK